MSRRQAMSGKILDPSVESEIAAVAAGVGCELAHAEWKGGVLRVFLDREEGVGLEHCEAVARQLSPLLDALEFGSGRYTLEVKPKSKPGVAVMDLREVTLRPLATPVRE